MIAAYVRVSSRSQDARTQRAAIEQAAALRGHRIGRWFDEKRSAKKLDRPELRELRELVRRGQIETLYVFRLDRLARSGIRDTLAVVDELRTAGVTLVNLADGFSLEAGGDIGDVVIAVLAWAAQMERQAIGERIAAARVRVEASGGNWGRPRRCDLTMERRMLELRRKGRSVRQIAIALKVPRTTVGKVVSRKGPYGPPPATAKKRALQLPLPPASR